jgi:hypothetical protein
MKISYRKNDTWGSITLFLNDISNLDNEITNKLKEKYSSVSECSGIDIVDVNISTQSKGFKYIVVVFYEKKCVLS